MCFSISDHDHVGEFGRGIEFVTCINKMMMIVDICNYLALNNETVFLDFIESNANVIMECSMRRA